jgi:N-acetylglucosaminyldiphosphoundecaprenol N-acetyl-beta-D-mannosaminyltransferase
MVPLLLDLAQEKGHRVFFLGGRDEVVAIAEEKIQARWPRLQIAGMYSPPFAPLDQMDHADLCRRIREAKADMLFVSFGCPKQEKWLAMNFREAGVPVAMGVGATIDFLAGAVKRAPVWMRKSGLEWLFRVIQEPRRLAKRYYTDFRIVVPGLLWQYLKTRSSGETQQISPAAPPAVQIAAPPENYSIITLPSRLDAIAARDAALWPADMASSVIIDASATTFLDSTGSGKLARLARTTREMGGKCYLAGANDSTLRTLDLMKLRNLFVEVATVEAAQRSIES